MRGVDNKPNATNKNTINQITINTTLPDTIDKKGSQVEPAVAERPVLPRRRPGVFWRRATRGAVLPMLVAAAWGEVRAGNTTLINWTGTTGAWSNRGNWLQGNIPDAESSEGARIANGGTAIVTGPVPDIDCLRIDSGRVHIQSGETLRSLQGADVFAGGTLSLADGRITSPQTKINGGVLEGFGVVAGDLSNDGVLRPGLAQTPLGTIGVTGNFRQGSTGTMLMQVSSSAPGGFDRLIVSGQATLGGRLRVEFLPNATIQPGVPLAMISGGSIQGGFQSVQFVSSSASKCFGWTCDADALFSIECFAVGDMNLDGVVDAKDSPLFALALVDEGAYQSQICSSTGYFIEPACIGNVDGANLFDFDDIAPFAGLAGLSVAAVTAEIQALQAAIPEPSSLAICASAALFWRRGRRIAIKSALNVPHI